MHGIERLASRLEISLPFRILQIEHDDCKWDHDKFEEFFADVRKYEGPLHFFLGSEEISLSVHFSEMSRATFVQVTAPERGDIESLFDIFERNIGVSTLPTEHEQQEQDQNNLKVFIGHGRNNIWRDLKDHLQDKHGIQIEAYETGARAGHAIRDIIEDMARSATFAILVMTAEDEQADGSMRARQNVIHEAGLFQGKLGFSRAVLLLEEGVEDFSNMHGVQHISFSKGNIKETYGEVLATIWREFPR